MSNLHPSVVSRPLAELDAAAFIDPLPNGIRGITWDLDKTLVDQLEPEVPQAHLALMRGIAELGIKQGIISNANTIKRTTRVMTIAKNIGDTIGPRIYVVTSMHVGGVRKPKSPVFDRMSRSMGLTKPQLCHVGDQLLNDVLGANAAGYGASVLVPPYGEGDDWLVRYLQRPVEAAIRPFVWAPLRSQNFGRRV